MRWYFQVRATQPERAPSRVLQVLETQRVLPRRFEAWQCHGAMHLRFLLETQEGEAFRLGWLLRRLPAIAAAHWLPVEDEQDEQLLWTRTALVASTDRETQVDLDPESAWWRAAPSITLVEDNRGIPVSAHDTEVRLQWTAQNLYLLFDSAYRQLSLAPGEAVLAGPTPGLWEHDVAEVFLGVDSTPFVRYMEFEVSPRGEWIDLDITADGGIVQHRAALHSGFESAARINPERRRWQAFFRIPLAGLQVEADVGLRLNLFRSQGPDPVELAWQPTRHESFHIPGRFGYLRAVSC